MTTQTTLELIESAITSIEDDWTKSALETLKEAQLQEKAMNQLRAGGIFPHASEANSDKSEQPAQHEGWKLVPIDANDTMIDAFENFIGRDIPGFRQAYQAMLNAAPQPQGEQK